MRIKKLWMEAKPVFEKNIHQIHFNNEKNEIVKVCLILYKKQQNNEETKSIISRENKR